MNGRGSVSKRVLITEPMPLVREEVKLLESRGVEVEVSPSYDEETLSSKARDVGVIMVVYAKITGKIIRSAEKLKGIVRYGIGVDNIDLKAATERGVIVANVPDYCIGTVADHTFALLLTLARKIIVANRLMKDKKYRETWTSPPVEIRGVDLEGKTLGIIGLGKIGRAVVKRAIGFGMRILAYDPYITSEVAERLGVKLVGLNELLRESDFVTIHAPLTKETYHLIGEEQLRLMKRTAYLINVARGPIVDEEALYRALREGWIAGAGIDVYEREPPDPENPLLKLENIVLTPHIAWYTEEALRRLEFTAVEQAIDILEGRLPKNIVNKEVLAKK